MNIEPNAKINVALAEDEWELLGMLKSMYKDYWSNADTGMPIEQGAEGNFWKIDYRVHRMENGTPSLEKEIYFKTADGAVIKTTDMVKDEFEGDVDMMEGLSRLRTDLENVAFLDTAISTKHRTPGDLVRVEQLLNEYVSFRNARPGRLIRKQLESMYPQLPESIDYNTAIEWKIKPGVDEWSVSRLELSSAIGVQPLPLAPYDGGRPRFVDTDEGAWFQGGIEGDVLPAQEETGDRGIRW